MTTELYLTLQEQKQLDVFPAQVRTGWQVHTEESDAYETPRQLQMRAFMSDFTAHPELAALADKLIKDPKAVSLEEFEVLKPELQEELYFIMGARGVRTIIAGMLTEEPTDETMYALSVLTTIRHKLLELNSQS